MQDYQEHIPEIQKNGFAVAWKDGITQSAPLIQKLPRGTRGVPQENPDVSTMK